jgi:hypothetical protein
VAIVAIDPSLPHLSRPPQLVKARGFQFMAFDANLPFRRPVEFRVYLDRGNGRVRTYEKPQCDQDEKSSHGIHSLYPSLVLLKTWVMLNQAPAATGITIPVIRFFCRAMLSACKT